MIKHLAWASVALVLSLSSAFAQPSNLEVLQIPTGAPGVSVEQEQYLAPAMSAASLSTPSTPALNRRNHDGSAVHFLPTMEMRKKIRAAAPAADTGPLLYHQGGLIMQQPFIYQIFWIPDKLQSGTATGVSPNFLNVNLNLAALYNGHGIANINTQYYQIINNKVTYIQTNGFLAGAVIDRNPYPPSGCNNKTTPPNCVDDNQLRVEIQNVVKFMKWQGGINNLFVIYTSAGEGTCFDSGPNSTDCSGVTYCAYHTFIPPASGQLNDVILYANISYPNNPAVCFNGGKSPNNDFFADTAATAASHEITEAIQDPLLNAWFTAQGNEGGDLCNQDFPPNTYANGLANQLWNGFPFEIQSQWDNHTLQCVQVGPLYVILKPPTVAGLQ